MGLRKGKCICSEGEVDILLDREATWELICANCTRPIERIIITCKKCDCKTAIIDDNHDYVCESCGNPVLVYWKYRDWVETMTHDTL